MEFQVRLGLFMNVFRRNVLGVFAKHWQPGTVKTRLAASIGDELAAQIHHKFVLLITQSLDSVNAEKRLAFCPSESEPSFRDAIADSWQLEKQSDGDLGDRMSSFFRSAFHASRDEPTLKYASPDAAILIGSDSPWLTTAHIHDAFDALERAEVVIGPCKDGGYYLIGMRQWIGQLFVGIDWSSKRVFPDTIERLQLDEITYEMLPLGYDVDDLDDLMKYRESLESKRNPVRLSPLEENVLELIETGLQVSSGKVKT